MKKYFIVMSEASDTIPNAEHIERNDRVCEDLGITDSYSDFDAAKDAMVDGVKLIGDMEGIYDNFYIDTPENRNIIKEYLTDMVFVEEKNNTRYENKKTVATLVLKNDYNDGSKNGETKIVEVNAKTKNNIIKEIEESLELNMEDMWKISNISFA